jgi:hypothetical protein
MANVVNVEQIWGELLSPPVTPIAGNQKIYPASDGRWKTLDSAGTVTQLGTGDGDIVGPASATNNAIVRFDATTGKLVKNSTPIIQDDGRISTVTDPSIAQDVATKNYVDANIFVSPLTTKGDLFTYSTVDTRLPVGTNNQLLVANSVQATGIEWRSLVAADIPVLDAGKITTGIFDNARINWASPSAIGTGTPAAATFT